LARGNSGRDRSLSSSPGMHCSFTQIAYSNKSVDLQIIAQHHLADLVRAPA
jgi:hypothetical protein